MNQPFVEVRIFNGKLLAESFGKSENGWCLDDCDLVFSSRLDSESSISEHLKWLRGMLQFERKKLKNLQANGVDMACLIRVKARVVSIEPEALLLMHECHLRTEIVIRK